MAARETVMRETDGADDGADTGTITGLTPSQPPALRSAPASARMPDAEDFEIVEVDDSGRAMNTTDFTADNGHDADADGTGAGTRREPTGSERDTGDGSYLDRQREQQERDAADEAGRSAVRRRSQKAGKERTIAENRRLNAEIGRLTQEMTDLKNRFGSVEPRVLELGEQRLRDGVTQINNELSAANGEYKQAQAAFIEAMESGDKAAMADALDRRDNAVIRRTQLQNTKTAAEARLAERGNGADGDNAGAGRGREANGQARDQGRTGGESRQQTISPAVQRHMDEFGANFPWYNPGAQNTRDRYDSRLVLQIDAEVSDEGFKPATREYWDEVERRMEEALPHRFDQERIEDRNANRQGANGHGNGNGNGANGNGRAQTGAAGNAGQRRGPPVSGSGSGGRQGNGGKTRVELTPQRKQALMDANLIGADGSVLDKPKLSRVLNQFAQYDREHPPAARS